MKALALAVAVAAASGGASAADELQWLGKARMFTNDALGDNQDRWRTGSYFASRFRGKEWTGSLPADPGELIEYRLRTEIIAPNDLTNPAAATDRRYVGALSLGVHTYFSGISYDWRLGGDLVVTGPSTGLGEFQDDVHAALGMPRPHPTILDDQIGDAVYPTASFEASKERRLSDTARLRTFVEGQAGAETLLRVGGDVIVGSHGIGSLSVRDVVTGQQSLAIHKGDAPGMSVLFGADAAYVADSAYLPSDLGYDVVRTRSRVRAGVVWQGKESAVFYGVTWLSKEFEAQPETQVLGSLSVRLKF